MAVPHPDRELERLQGQLRKGLPSALMITGASDWYRNEAIRLVTAAVPNDAELRIVDAGQDRAGGARADDEDAEDDTADEDGDIAPCAELQDLRGGGLFARRTVVLVRRATNWWKNHGAAVAAQAAKFAAGCSLVVEAAKLDKRRKAVAAFVKAAADDGTCVEFRDLWDQPWDRSRGPLHGELCQWVVQRAQALGVPLEPEAAWLVVLQVGKSLSELQAELQRLRDRLPADKGRRPLRPADLRGQLTCSFESTPFELADAVLGGDRVAAFRSVRAMYDRGVRGKDGRTGDVAGILPFATSWLFQSIASALEGRVLLDSGVSPRDLVQRANVRSYAERFVATVQRHDQRRLRHGLRALHHCQRASRQTGEDHEVLLERFLAMWFDGVPVPPIEEFES